MLHRIIGASGSGKTDYLLDRLGEALKKGKNCIVIVPEQQSVAYESALCKRFGDSVNMLCEVLNFERLPNRIAREYGGLAVNNIDNGGACALLSIIASEKKNELLEYNSVADEPDFAMSMFAFISRMKMAKVTPELIKKALDSGDLDGETRIQSKLHDILLIYSEYERVFGEDLCDPRDALTRLSDELSNKPFFKNTTVFIDNYYTFTEQEYSIIEEIIKQSKDTYISFTVVEKRSFFDENKKAAERILKSANYVTDDIYMSDPKRANFESLKYIERNLWERNVNEYHVDDGALRLISAKNRFDEVEAAASELCEFVRNGGRYSDITVLTGNPDAYSSIVDSVFSRAGIPVYMSAKEEIVSKPLFAFLLSSISVITEDFSLRSVKRYIKSGYTDLAVNESDILLSYAQSWKLRGKSWYNGEEWTLDPEGYREGDLTTRGAKMLKIANAARDKIVPPLSALRDSLSVKGLTVTNALKALYNHLISMEADERLRLSAERLLKKGERERSEREIQLWKILINIFDQLDSICGDREITPKRLISLIKLMCNCYSLGAIPASLDAVTFGDASLVRAGGSKMVVVLGVCDGEFPKLTQNSGFFDRVEAIKLEGANLLIADSMEKQLNTNRFFVYSAFSAPTDRLVLLCPNSELAGGELRPSTAWLSVMKMFPDVKIKHFDTNEALYSRESIASNFPSLQKGELRTKIEKSLKDSKTPYFSETPMVSDKTSRIEFNQNQLNLSPSKFETYAKCPFSFFGNYLLNLKEKKQNEFSMSEIGNFIHKILEQFMRECVSTGKFVCPDKEERRQLVTKLSKEYFLDVIGKQASEDKQFMHTYSNMVKTIDFVADNLCAEFSESDFLPVGFEFKIGLQNEDIPAIQYDVNGKTVRLRGSIDRVDTYVQNGIRYVRVVDYKTYDKTFSVDLVSYGLDSQLLHYLFGFCEKTNSVPAGVFYFTVTLPNISINGREDDEKLAKELSKCIKRNGIVLDNPEIVYAMSNSFKFVPVKRSQAGNLYAPGGAKKTYTDEEFKEIETTLKEQINKLASNVFDGNMDVCPLEVEGKTIEPCKYCSLGDICRNKKEEQEEEENDDDE